MKPKKFLIPVLALTLAMGLAACGGQTNTKPASGQPSEQSNPNYPDKPVKIVAPSGAGGGWDTTARLVSKVLSETKLVSVGLPVENIEGGSGKVFLESYMKNNVGDPYTIFVNSPPLILNAVQGFKYSYKDVTPIAGVISEFATYAVTADSKYKTLQDVMEALKKDPSSVKIAGGSTPGGMDHLAFMIAAKKAGVDITKINYVPFQGGGQAMTALLGKNVDLVSTGVSETLGQFEAGKIRLLAITGSMRLDGTLKDVPTLKEAGYDTSFEIWRGFFGPHNMPDYAKKYWEDTLAKMVKTPEWQEILKKQKWTDAYRNSADFTAFLEQQTQTIQSLMKELGLIK